MTGGKNELIANLKIYRKTNADSLTVDRTIRLLEKNSDDRVFFRDHFDDGHITGSVIVVNPEKTKILLMHHIKFGTWQQFGGHADGETHTRDTAIRELEEEAGIHEQDIELSQNIFHIDIHSVPEYNHEPAHYHYDVSYLAIVSEKLEYMKQEEEVHDIQWFSIDEVASQLGTGKFSSGFEAIFAKFSK